MNFRIKKNDIVYMEWKYPKHVKNAWYMIYV